MSLGWGKEGNSERERWRSGECGGESRERYGGDCGGEGGCKCWGVRKEKVFVERCCGVRKKCGRER